MHRWRVSWLGLFLGIVATPAFADGDAALGKKVFNKCKACHEAEKPVNKVGPHLKGIVGRPIASVEGYAYSASMKAYAAEGVWDEAKLEAYLKAPREVVPGTKMAFAGLRKPEDIVNIIAYLKSTAPAP